jgi:hypothetical protein
MSTATKRISACSFTEHDWLAAGVRTEWRRLRVCQGQEWILLTLHQSSTSQRYRRGPRFAFGPAWNDLAGGRPFTVEYCFCLWGATVASKAGKYAHWHFGCWAHRGPPSPVSDLRIVCLQVKIWACGNEMSTKVTFAHCILSCWHVQ